MTDFMGQVVAILTGVFGGAIGFLVIAAVAAMLVLPYLLLLHDPRGPETHTEVAPRHF